MRNPARALGILVILTVAADVGMAKAGATAADDHGSMVIVFRDGHRQNLEFTDVARIDFKSPAAIVFRDGRQSIPAADLVRIEFDEPANASVPGRNHFLGKGQVGQGNGSDFYITLEADGKARKSIGSPHGTWTVVDGEARISWDDGWHDTIRKVGTRHEKRAYEPGKTFDDAPNNVTAAKNTEAKPI